MQGRLLLWEASLLTRECAFFTGSLRGLRIDGSDGGWSYGTRPLHRGCSVCKTESNH